MRQQHTFNYFTFAILFQFQVEKKLEVFLLEVILKQISKRETQKEIINTRAYMPRVYEVRSPCQWLKNCYDGKCPAFIRQNGNFYCAKMKAPT